MPAANSPRSFAVRASSPRPREESRWKEAIATYRELIDANPKEVNDYLWAIAECHEGAGEKENAIKSLQLTCKTFPASGQASQAHAHLQTQYNVSVTLGGAKEEGSNVGLSWRRDPSHGARMAPLRRRLLRADAVEDALVEALGVRGFADAREAGPDHVADLQGDEAFVIEAGAGGGDIAGGEVADHVPAEAVEVSGVEPLLEFTEGVALEIAIDPAGEEVLVVVHGQG